MTRPTPKAGKLRDQVEIQEPRETRDSHGGTALVWDQIDIRWASVVPLSGRERMDSDHVQGQVTHRVWMRPIEPKPSPRARLIYEGRTLQVEAIIDKQERGILLEILCREEV